ncbi:hypothetical protein BFP97_00435 [Roseivirga sp. 4D4]|uniref:hypothetical protein n=1 Tax=Roseivirga sp. 4D4 TaxID=1889784 RepID=UPI000852BB15|nr:hypothetical protein [Roseivirga sp. 4D4]OEK00072.1 hypothetical protein BFP97_00435 [Roseivirga sp. 4D4]
MAQLRRPDDNEEGKLRRWVSNLQLESWQLELLITGFSIFLLATGVDQYEEFSASINFNKLVPSSSSNVVFVSAGSFIVNTIPIALKFFLISLLIHLLLRGFWIGIVGLSSVSNSIDLDSLKLKGPFRKKLPGKVRSLDDLIFYLDKVSSVIFAYTYLLAFSIISVVLVSAFLFSLLGVGAFFQNYIGSSPAVTMMISVLFLILSVILTICAVIYFLDTIFFSTFKKSKWFSVLYYPIYRLFSLISLSFVYRSIYYHLITNYSKKQIISVTLILGGTLFLAQRINTWETYPFFPEVRSANQYTMNKVHYDDERSKGHIRTASIPSKFVKNDYLELFIRYSPRSNQVLDFLCPEFRGLERTNSFTEAMNAGMRSAQDSTVTMEDLLGTDEKYEELVKSSSQCLGSLYEVYLDGEKIENPDFFFTRHENKGERGVETVIDITNLDRGRHLIQVNRFEFKGNPFFAEEVSEDRLENEIFVKISFWKE